MTDNTRHGRPRTPGRTSAVLGTALASTVLAGAALLTAACSGSRVQPGTAQPAAGSGQPAATAASRALGYARCMRAHGISDFPDPNSKGEFAINGMGNGGDLNPASPKNQAAARACQPLAPYGGTPAQQRQNYTAELSYAQCMRSHGEPNFPDPKPPQTGPVTGGQSAGSASNANGIDPNSTRFISANRTCQHYLPAGSPQPGTNQAGGGTGGGVGGA